MGSNKRVTFRLRAPETKKITVSGEFMEENASLVKDPDGIWSFTTSEPVVPEIYGYNFTIDGVKTIAPANADVKTGSTGMTIQSLLDVHGDAPTFSDGHPVPHGEIHSHWYEFILALDWIEILASFIGISDTFLNVILMICRLSKISGIGSLSFVICD